MNTSIASYLGMLILVLLCFVDFRSNVIRPRSSVAYFSALSLFIICNIFIYIVLLATVGQIEFHAPSFTFIFAYDGADTSSFKYRLISPTIIALLHFGTGAAKFKFKDKEVSIYNSLLSIFHRMFPLSYSTASRINSSLKALGEETHILTEKVSELHTIGESRNWAIPKEEWEIIDEKREVVEDLVDVLDDVKGDLGVEPISVGLIGEVRSRVSGEIEKLRTNINRQLRSYIRKLLSLNIRDERAIDQITIIINTDARNIVEKQEHSPVSRVLGFSIFFGIILGLAIEVITPSHHIPFHMHVIILTFSLFVFFYFIAQNHHFPKSAQGFCYCIISGAAGGALSRIVYSNLPKISMLLKPPPDQSAWGILIQGLPDYTTSLCIGVFSSTLIFLFYHFISKKFRHSFLGYVAISGLGGMAFWLVFLALGHLGTGDAAKHAVLWVSGFIVLLGCAFVTGAIKSEIEKPETDHDPTFTEAPHPTG